MHGAEIKILTVTNGYISIKITFRIQNNLIGPQKIQSAKNYNNLAKIKQMIIIIYSTILNYLNFFCIPDESLQFYIRSSVVIKRVLCIIVRFQVSCG